MRTIGHRFRSPLARISHHRSDFWLKEGSATTYLLVISYFVTSDGTPTERPWTWQSVNQLTFNFIPWAGA
jgi:hypothetical protein